MEGKVKLIFPDGRTGFIAGNNRKDYYFRVKSFKNNNGELKPGLKVQFLITKSYDFKKKKESEEAIKIEVK